MPRDEPTAEMVDVTMDEPLAERRAAPRAPDPPEAA